MVDIGREDERVVVESGVLEYAQVSRYNGDGRI